MQSIIILRQIKRFQENLTFPSDIFKSHNHVSRIIFQAKRCSELFGRVCVYGSARACVVVWLDEKSFGNHYFIFIFVLLLLFFSDFPNIYINQEVNGLVKP
jgi:hypothetical protein